MVAKHWREIALACIVTMLAACGQQAAPQVTKALPTATLQAEAATSVPTATPIVRDTLPPTWTPAISYTPSITLTPSVTLTPSITLTASKTPTASNTPTSTLTPTVTYTPSPNATEFALLGKPRAPECVGFAADASNRTQFKFGSAYTVKWIAAASVAVYQVRLYDVNQVTLLTDKTTDTSYTFSTDLLNQFQNYSWTVSPLDADGVQICSSIGALLLPTP